MKIKILLAILWSLGIIFPVIAGSSESDSLQKKITLPPERVTLKPGPGQDKVLENCAVCHSLDYISMQPPGSRAQWTATVQKMIRVFGAAIPEDTAPIIIEYLAVQYGSGK
jgi:sulfite dehydrogenase (cytochrome) subunit B